MFWMSLELGNWLTFKPMEWQVTVEIERNRTNFIDVWMKAKLGMELEAGESI